METLVAGVPDDARTREALIEHYAARATQERGNGPATERLQAHDAWLVDERPGSGAAAWVVLLPFRSDALAQADRIRAWLRAAETHPQDANVLENAGTQLIFLDQPKGLELLRRARELPARTAADGGSQVACCGGWGGGGMGCSRFRDAAGKGAWFLVPIADARGRSLTLADAPGRSLALEDARGRSLAHAEPAWTPSRDGSGCTSSRGKSRGVAGTCGVRGMGGAGFP